MTVYKNGSPVKVELCFTGFNYFIAADGIVKITDISERDGLKIMDMLEKHGKYRKINLYGKTLNGLKSLIDFSQSDGAGKPLR